MKLLVSACLLGVACRYDGASKGLSEDVLRALMARHTLVPVCPEQLGGLPTPRAPSERLGSRVVARTRLSHVSGAKPRPKRVTVCAVSCRRAR